MNVRILQPKGYCAGVSRAIKMAYQAKKDYPDKQIYVLGMLVHNDIVVKQLEKDNIKTAYDINNIPDGEVIIFTAHGHDERLDKIAKKKELIIYDAICPIVKNNLERIKNELKDNHQVIYIGINTHPETIAAISLDRNIFLYPIDGQFNYQLIKDKNPCVVNQTTLNVLELDSIYKNILSYIPEARILDEICYSTRKRQESITQLDDKDVDLIVIVGDEKSSNSTRLLEVAKMSHPNISSIMISSFTDLNKEDFINKKSIVIASGASVSEETIDAIYRHIVDFK